MLFLWIKVLHVVAMVAWMAGIFYLPRLFVYHCKTDVGSETDLTFRVMEAKLLRVIMRPAAIVTVLAGLALVFEGGFSFASVWLAAKLVGVLALVGFHLLLERYQFLFSRGWRGHSDKYFRLINEIPTILLIWIVVWVVVKPFS